MISQKDKLTPLELLKLGLVLSAIGLIIAFGTLNLPLAAVFNIIGLLIIAFAIYRIRHMQAKDFDFEETTEDYGSFFDTK